MKERPILFSTPMIQAILAGRKTMTRRIVKGDLADCYFQSLVLHATGLFTFIKNGNYNPIQSDVINVRCHYGQPGDRLWVKETFAKTGAGILYKADKNMGFTAEKWTPSIFMPRAASRILLEIVSVNVERLQDISDENAVNEGIENITPTLDDATWKNYNTNKWEHVVRHFTDPKLSFQSLWQSIHGQKSLEANPWVWVIEFKVI